MGDQFQLSTDVLFDAIKAGDEIIAKTLGVSEVAQIARIEKQLREYILRVWRELSDQAVKKAVSLARQKKTANQISAGVDRIMNNWSDKIKKRYLNEIKKIYRLGRVAGWKKANGIVRGKLTYDIPKFKVEVRKDRRRYIEVVPSFGIVDEEAVEALQDHEVFWIGEHYKKNISGAIAKTAREGLVEAGRSPTVLVGIIRERVREELGQVVIPPKYVGSDVSYFEGLTANAATVARNFGQLRSFEEYGITKYQIQNPNDSRTCPECSHMDQKVFTVSQGAKVMEAELEAKTPEQIKAAHPWMSLSQIKELSEKPGMQSSVDSKALADAGFCMPPFHFRCRCTVDVSAEAGSWEL